MIQKTSTRENALIWFGAAISIAEILTGTLLAPLGMGRGLLAIAIGHLIGGVLFYLMGAIGGATGVSAMETVKRSFGQKGSLLFSSLNVVQLIGWTAIMIFEGALAAQVIAGNVPVWSLAIGALILVWLAIGVTNLGKVNTVMMLLLLGATFLLSFMIFGRGAGQAVPGDLTFGQAVELSAAMPLSWLPLVSDYTRFAKKPRQASLASCLTYNIASAWMFLIGMGAAIFTGETEIGRIFMMGGLGLAGLFIIIGSTVTTTFLDAYSAGVSAVSISSKLKEKPVAIAVTVAGVLMAVFLPVMNLQGFLFFIGSVFAPMVGVMITDFFILKKNYNHLAFSKINLGVWTVGFVCYRLLLKTDTPVGVTLPAVLITVALTWIANKALAERSAS